MTTRKRRGATPTDNGPHNNGSHNNGSGRLTQRMIAERLGLSPATVSLAMRDSPLVAEATRKLVKETVQDSGYVYNRSAASLRTHRTHIVGVAFHDITNPYLAELLASVEAAMSHSGRTVFLSNHGDDPQRQDRFLEMLREYNADGLIISPAKGTDPARIERLAATGVAVVQVARRLPELAVDYVVNDDEHGMYLATRHLIGLGHRRIAMLGTPRRTTVGQLRVKGYLKALREAGLPNDETLMVHAEISREGGLLGIHQLFDGRRPGQDGVPTGVVCFNDLVAFGALLGLRQLGLEPGRDCSVIGCDDVPEAALWSPKLSSVANQPDRIGARAAELLLERIADPTRPAQAEIVEPHLSLRESCQAPIG